jgi:predicted PurR-regulated permease PerM
MTPVYDDERLRVRKSLPDSPGGNLVLLADDYPVLGVFWSMLIFFVWIAWFMLLFHIVADVFRRRDASGAKKTAWLIFLIFVPFLGVFVYLIAEGDDMAKRNIQQAEAQRSEMDEYVRATAGSGPASEIEKAKGLLDSGAISQAEFDAIKAKALG